MGEAVQRHDPQMSRAGPCPGAEVGPEPQEEGPRGSGFWTSQWKVPMCGDEKTGLGGRGSTFFCVQGFRTREAHTGRTLILLLFAQVNCGVRLSTCQPMAKRGRPEDGRPASLGHPSIS